MMINVIKRIARKMRHICSQTDIVIRTKYKKETGNNKLYEKKQTINKKVHVVVNGPSFNETLQYIQDGEDVIIVNYALKDERIRKLLPKILVIVDPAFAKEEKADYLKEIDRCLKENIIEKVVMNTTIYNTWKQRGLSDRAETINQISTNEVYNSSRDKKKYERNMRVPIFQTVAIAALYVAIQEGYSEIWLHGNDFNWLQDIFVDNDCHLCAWEKHFYGKEKIDYTELLGMHLKDLLKADLTALMGYDQLKEYAMDENVKIYNLSLNSLLDMFEKKVFD